MVDIQTRSHSVLPAHSAALVPLLVLVDHLTSLPAVPAAPPTTLRRPPVQALLLQDGETPDLTSVSASGSVFRFSSWLCPQFQLLAPTSVSAPGSDLSRLTSVSAPGFDLGSLWTSGDLLLPGSEGTEPESPAGAAGTTDEEPDAGRVKGQGSGLHHFLFLSLLLTAPPLPSSSSSSLLLPPPLGSSLLLLQFLAAVVLQMERIKGTRSSFMLFIFWTLLVFCSLVPLRGAIEQIVEQVSSA